jgi:serine/threonine-protein kinase
MIGTQLGKWVIAKELGRGGMGRVYLAHAQSSGQPAALKVLSVELAQESGFLERFHREIEVLGKLSHPNIVRFYESGVHDGIYYFAMEYVAGDNFEQLLHQQGRLPWKEVLDAALQICPALKHAHDRGIVHRDIKPPNLLRTAVGEVKLTDFGIAKVFAARHLTHTGGVVGTAEFLSPEQAAGKQATKRSDLYSLGAVLYNLLTGRAPFEGASTVEVLHKHLYAQFDRPQKLVPEIPHDLDEVICQLLEKDPSRRPADGLVLHRQFDSVRRKLERKAHLTSVSGPSDRTVVENQEAAGNGGEAGPATLMSHLMREELNRQKQGSTLGQWLNRPWVIVPLFLTCVGLLIWSFARPGPSAEELFKSGSDLMTSPEPADWDQAWGKFFEPLNRTFPNHPYRQEVEAYRQWIEDRAALRRALAGVKASASTSEAQRFYLRGRRLCEEGDAKAAERTWRNLVAAFGEIETEARWVKLAEAGLAWLNSNPPAKEAKNGSIQEAIARVRRLRAEGKLEEAKTIARSLEALYPEDAELREQLQK